MGKYSHKFKKMREEATIGVRTRAMAKRMSVTCGEDQLSLATSRMIRVKRRLSMKEEETIMVAMLADDLDSRVSDHVLEGYCSSTNGSPNEFKHETVRDADLAYHIQGESVEQAEAIASNFDHEYRFIKRDNLSSSTMPPSSKNNTPPPSPKTPCSPEPKTPPQSPKPSPRKRICPPLKRKSPLRRSLPRRRIPAEMVITHEELKEIFTPFHPEARSELETFKNKYNYNFEDDVPLEGPFKWVAIEP